MRRFNFGSGDKEGESAQGPTGDGGESPRSESWLPVGREGWEQAGDRPAPMHSEREHGLEGAQTPEGDVAHPSAPSQEPDTAAPTRISEGDGARGGDDSGNGSQQTTEVPVGGGQASQAQPADEAHQTAEAQARGAEGVPDPE